MTSYVSLLSSEGLKLRSCLKISSHPAYTEVSFFFFFFEILNEGHCKWINQHMINNNNINNDNNNSTTPVVVKYRVGIRRGIAMPHGQVGIFSLGC